MKFNGLETKGFGKLNLVQGPKSLYFCTFDNVPKYASTLCAVGPLNFGET